MNQPWVHMCSPNRNLSHLSPHPIPQGHPSAPALSTLSHASNLDCQSVSRMIIYMFQCYSLRSSHPRLPAVLRLSFFPLTHAWAVLQLVLSYISSGTAKLLQSCPTLCDPIDGSPPGSPVPGILQARTRSGLAFPSPMHESEK